MATPKLEKLYEDDDVVVINKPAGLLTIPDRYQARLPNMRDILKEQYGSIFVVHRLDRETSGAIIFAKNAEAHKNLNDQFEHHTVKKIYHTVVSGIVSQDEMAIDIPLAPDPVKKGLVRPSARGKEALTTIRVLERYRMATFLECNLHTGRQHQIRVHCAAIGYPLLVDENYAGTSEFMLSSIKKKFNLAKHTEEKPLISRLTLHAYSLTFKHPSTEEEISVVAPYPKDFRALLNSLGKYATYKTTFKKF
ncbi:MAG: RluA family pseudouridine synthase [Bacteroidota bacterium]